MNSIEEAAMVRQIKNYKGLVYAVVDGNVVGTMHTSGNFAEDKLELYKQLLAEGKTFEPPIRPGEKF